MAGETAIAAIISMALTYCRRHERHEVDAAIRIWSSVFTDTDAETLKGAVIRWAETLDEDAIRAQTLPLPQTLKRIMGEGRERIEQPAEAKPRTPVRPEFAAAHRDARRQITLMASGPKDLKDTLSAYPKARPTKHEHVEPTYGPDGEVVTFGNEECRACNADELDRRDAAERRAKIQAVLDDLPQPETDAEDRRNWSGCRCDGSGMIDTKASEAAMLGADAPREVYPCDQCNADLFGRWERGELSRAS